MNKKSLVFSSIVAGLALVSIVLLFIPLVNIPAIEEFEEMGIKGGNYSLFAFGNVMGELMNAMMAGAPEGGMMSMMGMIFTLPNTLVLAISCGILAFAILSILTACNVIKSTKAAKAFNIVAIVFGSFAILFTLILAGVDLMLPSMMEGSGLTLNLSFALVFPVMAIAMVVFASIALHVVKKAARQAAAQAAN